MVIICNRLFLQQRSYLDIQRITIEIAIHLSVFIAVQYFVISPLFLHLIQFAGKVFWNK
jgi:hypothetical protein